jgi:hypothetical protein
LSDKAVRVRFVSDAFVSRKGFQIIWTTNPPVRSEAERLGRKSLERYNIALLAFSYPDPPHLSRKIEGSGKPLYFK